MTLADSTVYFKQVFMNSSVDLQSYRSSFVTDPGESIEFFLNNTLTTSVLYHGVQQLTYGVLVKDHHDYEYIKHVVKDKR